MVASPSLDLDISIYSELNCHPSFSNYATLFTNQRPETLFVFYACAYFYVLAPPTTRSWIFTIYLYIHIKFTGRTIPLCHQLQNCTNSTTNVLIIGNFMRWIHAYKYVTPSTIDQHNRTIPIFYRLQMDYEVKKAPSRKPVIVVAGIFLIATIALAIALGIVVNRSSNGTAAGTGAVKEQPTTTPQSKEKYLIINFF